MSSPHTSQEDYQHPRWADRDPTTTTLADRTDELHLRLKSLQDLVIASHRKLCALLEEKPSRPSVTEARLIAKQHNRDATHLCDRVEPVPRPDGQFYAHSPVYVHNFLRLKSDDLVSLIEFYNISWADLGIGVMWSDDESDLEELTAMRHESPLQAVLFAPTLAKRAIAAEFGLLLDKIEKNTRKDREEAAARNQQLKRRLPQSSKERKRAQPNAPESAHEPKSGAMLQRSEQRMRKQSMEYSPNRKEDLTYDNRNSSQRTPSPRTFRVTDKNPQFNVNDLTSSPPPHSTVAIRKKA